MGGGASSNYQTEGEETGLIQLPPLQPDGIIEHRDEYHEKYTPDIAFSPQKAGNSQLEAQAASHWHRILTHTKNSSEAKLSSSPSNENVVSMISSPSKKPPLSVKAADSKDKSVNIPTDAEKHKEKLLRILRGPSKLSRQSSVVTSDSDDDSDDSDDDSDSSLFSAAEEDDNDDDESDKSSIDSDEVVPLDICYHLPEIQITLKSRTASSISLSWDVDPVCMDLLNEIHFSSQYKLRPKYELKYREIMEIDDWKERWIIAVNDTHSHGGTIKKLHPNCQYAFSCKRKNWDKDFSHPVVIRTGPGPPTMPTGLSFKEVTSNSILLVWHPPEKDNGLPITEYIVSMKPWGESFRVAYRGKDRLFLATNLCSNLVYVFDVRAINKAGESPPAEKVSARTLKVGSAVMTPWIESIDFQTGKLFYSHPSTGAMAWSLPKGALLDEADSFRMKRCHFRHLMTACQQEALKKINSDFHYNSLTVSRSNILEQSLHQLYSIEKTTLDAGPIRIRFENEDGIDAGGLAKDWYFQVAKALRASGSGIFTLLPSGEVTIDPRSTAILASFELRWIFKAVGIYMAKALLDGYTLGISLSPLFLSLLCDKSPSMEDLAACEPHYHNGLQYVLNNDVSEMELTFSCSYELFDGSQVVELKQFGISESVTEENKVEYVELMKEWLIRKRYEPGITYLLEGFYEHIKKTDIQYFRPNELQILLGGLQILDYHDIIKDIRYAGGFTAESLLVQWLFEILENMDQITLGKFLSFVSGCPSLPIDGLNPTMLLTASEENEGSFPKSHTCFNQLVLPRYSSMEILKEKLLYAIENAVDGFFMS